MIARTVYLGENIEVTASFFKDNIAVPSIDPSVYPFYVVKDINQDFVTGGVGTLKLDNLYHASIVMPDTAAISTDVAKYVIEWELISVTNEKYHVAEFFDVVHPTYNDILNKEQQKITLSFSPLLLNIPLPKEPDDISFKVYDQSNKLIYTGIPTGNGMYSESYIYEVTIPANTLSIGKQYAAVWTFDLGTQSVYVQKITVIDTLSLMKVSDMRMYLDKVCKDIDLYVGYRDSDLIFHLNQGLNIINLISPITEWKSIDFTNYTYLQSAEYAWVQAACLSALKAQYLAEGDNAFDYSGQPLSLTVDRTQYIESEISRIQEFLSNEFKEFKKQLINRQHGIVLGLTYPNVNSNMNYGINRRRLGIPLSVPIIR